MLIFVFCEHTKEKQKLNYPWSRQEYRKYINNIVRYIKKIEPRQRYCNGNLQCALLDQLISNGITKRNKRVNSAIASATYQISK